MGETYASGYCRWIGEEARFGGHVFLEGPVSTFLDQDQLLRSISNLPPYQTLVWEGHNHGPSPHLVVNA